jgi:hypothetical protein
MTIPFIFHVRELQLQQLHTANMKAPTVPPIRRFSHIFSKNGFIVFCFAIPNDMWLYIRNKLIPPLYYCGQNIENSTKLFILRSTNLPGIEHAPPVTERGHSTIEPWKLYVCGVLGSVYNTRTFMFCNYTQ